MNGMAVKTHYSVHPLSLVFLYSIVGFVFSLIFLFRDVILTHGRFVFVFFLTSFDEGVVGKRGAACGNVTFGTAGTVVLAHSGVFLRCGGTRVTSWKCERVCVLARFVWQRSVCWLFSTLPSCNVHMEQQKPSCGHFCLYSQSCLNFRPGTRFRVSRQEPSGPVG